MIGVTAEALFRLCAHKNDQFMFSLDGYIYRGLYRGSFKYSESGILEWPKNGESGTFYFSVDYYKESNRCSLSLSFPPAGMSV